MDTFSQTQDDYGLFPQVGQNWANYKILEEIGRGGMGIVYRAVETNPQRNVAIKLILHTSQELNKRFQREIEISANLNHPYITKVYNFKKCHNFLALIIEYIDGLPLDEYVKENTLSTNEKVKIIIDICEALEYAHNNNIIHRDLKPANILITQNRKPKIIDFGIARQMDRKFDLTKTGEVMGTPNYMAPEQLRGKRLNIDHQCDIYAIGCVLYEIITNEKMINGKSIVQILFNIEHQKVNTLRSIDKNISHDLENIWKNAVARKKEDRYQSIAQMKEDLQKFLKGQTVKRNLSKNVYRSMFVASLFIIVLTTMCFYAFLSERQANVEITEEEKKIMHEIEKKNYYEAISIYNNTNLINTNLLMRSITVCYAELKKVVIAEMGKGDTPKLKKYIHIILEKFPNDAEMIYLLSKTYLPPGKYAEAFNFKEYPKENIALAQQNLERCIEINPYSSEYFLLLGKLEFLNENYDISCKYLQKTLDLDKENTEALELLYQIPYKNPKLQRNCYQYIIKSVDNLDDLSLYHLNLFTQKFRDLENEYHQYYLQYLAASNAHKEVDFLNWLQKIDLYEWNERLYSSLLVFRYEITFESELKNLSAKNNDIRKRDFIGRLLQEAQEMKQQEYRNFWCYQILYDYNRKSMNNVLWSRQKDSLLKKEMEDIILCSVNEESIWMKFATTQMYLEKYGFCALDNLRFVLTKEKAPDTNINKTIIISVAKKQGMPMPNEILVDTPEWQCIPEQDMEFFEYLVASNIYNHHVHYPKDSFWRIQKRKLMPITQQEKYILEKLLDSSFEKAKVKAAINLAFLLEKDDILLQKSLLLLEEIMSNSSKDIEIRQYIHYYFWFCPHVRDNQPRYKQLFLKSLNDTEDTIIKMVLAHHNNLSTFFNDDEIISKIQNLLASDIKNLENAKKIRLYAILALGLSKITKYKDLKKLFENSQCSSFERLYGSIIKVYALFYHKRATKDATLLEILNEYIQDVKESDEAYFKCFNLYFCSFLQCHFIKEEYKNEDLLQNVLYQLYRGIDLKGINFFLPRRSQVERLDFAEKNLQHPSPKIKYYALASYVSLLQDEEIRDAMFKRALAGDSSTKKATAFGFYQTLERINIEKSDHSIAKIFETKPSEVYLNYIEDLISFLTSQFENKKQRFVMYKKWIDNAYELDPENSKYIFEKGLFAYIEKDYDKSLMLINAAIAQEPKNYTYLLTRAKVFYSQKKTQECVSSLDIAINQVTSLSSLRQIAKMYLDVKSYENASLVYDRIFKDRAFNYMEEYAYLVISYINLNREQDAIRTLKYVNEIRKRIAHHKGEDVTDLDRLFFAKYEKNYPEIKTIEKNWKQKY